MIALIVLAVLALWVATMAVTAYLVTYRVNKVHRYAVTLKYNEGSFIALCTQKRWNYWTFEDVRVQPVNPGGAVVQAAPGPLHVPHANILYYQEIVETVNVDE